MVDRFFCTMFTADTQLFHFSFARYALVEAFRRLQLQPGDKVLLPEYLCRDVLASLHVLGLEPVWYPVDHHLGPALASSEWPIAKAVLAVNYFGFPQDLAPFETYAKRSGAVVIEDNAHGFLSRDSLGRLLGTRTDLGLFSYRKTFLLGRGAGLAINRENLKQRVSYQVPFKSLPMPREIQLRRQLQRIFGTRLPAHLLAKGIRLLRQVQGKSAIPPTTEDAEHVIPGTANPDDFLISTLNGESAQREGQRRRHLYQVLHARAKSAGLTPVYSELPEHTVPYGLALFSDDPQSIAKLAAQVHLDFFKWPDLPTTVLAQAPKHYSEIYLINFL